MTAAAALAGLAAGLGAWSAADLVRLGRGRAGRARVRRLRVPRALARLAPQAPPGLAERLAAAGAPAGVRPGEVMALKVVLAAGAAASLPAVWGLVPGRLAPMLLVVAPVAGFLAPDAALVRRGRRRAAALRAEAPDVLDRLRLAVEAGLGPGRALERACAHGRGPLSAELRGLAAAVACGAPRGAALERLRRRCPVPEVQALAAALARADRHGAPLGPQLAALAAGARAERARRIRSRAQRAAPKIQLVVALLLVPAALLLIAAGLLTSLR